MAELSVAVSGGHQLILFVTRGVLLTLSAHAPDDIETNKGFVGCIKPAAANPAVCASDLCLGVLDPS